MITFTTTDIDRTLNPRTGSVLGWHVRAGATPAVVNLRNGGVTGPIFVPINVPASSSVQLSYSRPVLFPKGLFIDTDANVTAGSVVPG